MTLHLEYAHGWRCFKLHKMLKRLTELRSLSLFLPNCCGPYRFTLSGTYPHLRSFTLSSLQLQDTVLDGEPSTKDFLARHSQLEYLAFDFLDFSDYRDTRSFFTLRPGDLSNLRAIQLGSQELDVVTDLNKLSFAKLEALKIDFMPKVEWSVIAPSLASLRYLDLDCNGHAWSTIQNQYSGSHAPEYE